MTESQEKVLQMIYDAKRRQNLHRDKLRESNKKYCSGCFANLEAFESDYGCMALKERIKKKPCPFKKTVLEAKRDREKWKVRAIETGYMTQSGEYIRAYEMRMSSVMNDPASREEEEKDFELAIEDVEEKVAKEKEREKEGGEGEELLCCVCANCDAVVDKGDKFCRNCGKDLAGVGRIKCKLI